ncbi:MAG: shikimate kinase [Nitratireductor sp.]
MEGDKPADAATMDAADESRVMPTIVLIGLMGAGKTAVGKRLASRLGMRFVDADQEIEAAAGCSIADIFALHGEQAFRDGERRVIARLLEDAPHVLATGGGAWMDSETRENVAKRALSVWLRADIDVLIRRTSRRTHRPLLRGRDHGEVLRKLQAERYPVYAQADIIVDTEDCPLELTVDRVASAIENFLR